MVCFMRCGRSILLPIAGTKFVEAEKCRQKRHLSQGCFLNVRWHISITRSAASILTKSLQSVFTSILGLISKHHLPQFHRVISLISLFDGDYYVIGGITEHEYNLCVWEMFSDSSEFRLTLVQSMLESGDVMGMKLFITTA
uniref:Netrin-1 n=1 Tax=Parascaris univalens TaxID=6257 RepID=A0A915A4V4_PARUN